MKSLSNENRYEMHPDGFSKGQKYILLTNIREKLQAGNRKFEAVSC